MQLLRGFENSGVPAGCVLTIGNFDGVHRGHQAMLSRLVAHAREQKTQAVVLTFDPHPITLLRPEHTPPRLSTLERKLELLEKSGVDCTIAYPTDRELLELTAEEFFQKFIKGKLRASGLVEGPNFYFGKNRTGNIARLQELCIAAGLFLDVVEPQEIDGMMISSSQIRKAIQQGELKRACAMLGHPYRVEGTVVRGAARGATLGFPTANLEDVQTLLPAEGVYAGEASVDAKSFSAAIHVGPNPTFDDDARKLEVHLIGFDGTLYGSSLKVDFLAEIRGVRRFENAAELKTQLERDIKTVRVLVSDPPAG